LKSIGGNISERGFNFAADVPQRETQIPQPIHHSSSTRAISPTQKKTPRTQRSVWWVWWRRGRVELYLKQRYYALYSLEFFAIFSTCA
jgi:hypothetical protein